jgi:hypothetical protein
LLLKSSEVPYKRYALFPSDNQQAADGTRKSAHTQNALQNGGNRKVLYPPEDPDAPLTDLDNAYRLHQLPQVTERTSMTKKNPFLS